MHRFHSCSFSSHLNYSQYCYLKMLFKDNYQQLVFKYIFRLEENVSRAVSQLSNSLGKQHELLNRT